MTIALVDDDAKFLAQAARLLENVLEQCAVCAEVATFSSGEKLLASRSAGARYDMYLLDVVMPGMDGIALGRQLRREQPDAPLLFFTTSRDYAVEAIGIEAVGYVVKPFTHKAFAEALARAFKRLALARPPFLMLKAQGGYVNVPLQDIVYVETRGHYIDVCLCDGRSISVRQSLQELLDTLKDDVRIVRVGRQLIVNMAQVKRYSGGVLALSTGKCFAVPRRSLSEVKDAFARFYGA